MILILTKSKHCIRKEKNDNIFKRLECKICDAYLLVTLLVLYSQISQIMCNKQICLSCCYMLYPSVRKPYVACFIKEYKAKL